MSAISFIKSYPNFFSIFENKACDIGLNTLTFLRLMRFLA